MKERIKLLAKQCWDERPEGQLHFDNEKFAELVAAQEREECAALCFSIWNEWLDTPEEDRYKVLYDAEDCATAIRARGTTSITSAQAMLHPTVVETINALSESCRELREELETARADEREKCAKLVVNLFDPADNVAEFIAEKILARGTT